MTLNKINVHALIGLSLKEVSVYLQLVETYNTTEKKPMRYDYSDAINEFDIEIDDLVNLLQKLDKREYIKFKSIGMLFDVVVLPDKGVLSAHEEH